jgi:ABC-2 type transport system ATP-binding protein
MGAKVIVRDLEKRYGPVQAARGVSFEIRDGETFGLIGPNGAGKTTTVECVIGLRDPDAGTIEVCGLDARRRPRDVKQKIGAALQTTSLQDKITPREALDLFASFYDRPVSTAALIERFNLEEKADAAFDTLSGGQRQRLALALAFVNNPELVFLDEPTAGLDPRSRHELHGEIAAMKRDGHTVLLTTHNLAEAEALCDRIAIIDRGRIVATGTPAELSRANTSASAVTLRAVAPIDPAWLDGLAGAEDLVVDRHDLRFRSAAPNRTVAELLARLDARSIEVVELHVQRASLEEVFLALTRTDTD